MDSCIEKFSRSSLTDADSSKQSDGSRWLFALRKHRFDDIVCKRQRHNSLRAGPNYHALDPQSQESQERSKCLIYVRVIGSRPHDEGAQFAVAIRTYHRENSTEKPHYKRESWGPSVLQNPTWADEDARPNDAADNHRHAVKQGDLLL